jgi:hypothetical protein
VPGPLDRNFAAWRALRYLFVIVTVAGLVVGLLLTVGAGKGTKGSPGVGPVVSSTCPLVICPPP